MLKENLEMKSKIRQLESETEIVAWYLKVMEEGVDTKEIVKEYSILKKKHKHLSETSSRRIKKLEAKYQKYKQDFENSLSLLKKQQGQVVYPLIS